MRPLNISLRKNIVTIKTIAWNSNATLWLTNLERKQWMYVTLFSETCNEFPFLKISKTNADS